MMHRWMTAGLLALVALLAGCVDESQRNFEEVDVEEQMAEDPQQDLWQMIQDNDQLEQLAQFVEQADLTETLQQEGPFTVFAPTDAAFVKMDEQALSGLVDDTTRLRTVLAYHIVPDSLVIDQVPELESATTLQGNDVHFGSSQRGAMVNRALIITPNMRATNGIVHPIDGVLMPVDADQYDDL